MYIKKNFYETIKAILQHTFAYYNIVGMELRVQLNYGNAETLTNLATMIQTLDTTLGQQQNISRRRKTKPCMVYFAILISFFCLSFTCSIISASQGP